MNADNPCQLPSLRLAQAQATWLSSARSRLLRAADIHRARHILDLGCGWGGTSIELARRSAATVIGLDHQPTAIAYAQSQTPSELQGRLSYCLASAHQIPLPDDSVDVVFTQCSLLWIKDVRRVLGECQRVLASGGRMAMIEPDYGGLMEHPPQIAARDLWMEALAERGADPLVGRQLLSYCTAAGLSCQAYLLDRYLHPQAEYLKFLGELPLADTQRDELNRIQAATQQRSSEQLTVHLPYWLVIAVKQT
ncbi:MAG: methyltransferase domain-containing protein [Pirellulaceae bacterium]|nr:methyltransferase domain-containing protein [Pirellulaceae bacterium]